MYQLAPNIELLFTEAGDFLWTTRVHLHLLNGRASEQLTFDTQVEIADTLFGVTMGQDGASQVLSRQLSRSVEGPARPYVRRQLRLVNS